MSENLPVETIETVGALEIDQKLTDGSKIENYKVYTDENGRKSIKFTISTVNKNQ